MALSKSEIAMYAFITGRVLPKGTTRKAFTTAVNAVTAGAIRAAPVAARGGTAALRTGAALARRNPAAAAGLAGYGAYQAGAFDPVEEAIQMEVERRTQDIMAPIELARQPVVQRAAGRVAKRKVSKYSKAIKMGMAAVKSSKFNGKKGKISNAKTTFAKVNKVASAVNKGRKVSAKGVTGVIKRAVSKYL